MPSDLGLRELRPEGFEPPTYGSEDHCSIQLSYGRSRDRVTIPSELHRVQQAFYAGVRTPQGRHVEADQRSRRSFG